MAGPARAAVSCLRTGSHRYASADPTLERVSVMTSRCRHAAPWVILIHGGSWINGKRRSMDRAADVFYRHGWQTFNIDYRRGAHVSWPMQQRDLLAAYRWITGHARAFGLDLSRGSVYGFSAGGHMAAWLGNREPRLSSIVTVSGVLQPQRVADDDAGARPDTEPTTPQMHRLHLREIDMMGCDWTAGTTLTTQPSARPGIQPWQPGRPDSLCGARWASFLPGQSITTHSPPVYMLQGDLDLRVPHPTPDAYGWHLGRAHVGHVVVHVAGLGHTQHLFLSDPHRQWAVVRWMREQWS